MTRLAFLICILPLQLLASGYIQVPASCLGKELPCAISAAKSMKVKIYGQEVALQSGSSLLILEPAKWQVIEGGFWATGLDDVKLLFGQSSFELSGDVLFTRVDKAQVIVRNLDGNVSFTPQNKKAQVVPPGYENWFRGISQGGSEEYGVIKPIESESLFKELSQMGLVTEEFKEKHLETYRINRQSAFAESAQLYKDILLIRKLASDTKAAEIRRQEQRAAKEQQDIRDMFRSRFFEPPELDSN